MKQNNPNGYNRFKKNNNKEEIQPAVIDKEMIQKAFREKWIAKNNLLAKSQRYSFLKRKFFGLDAIEKELEDLYQ